PSPRTPHCSRAPCSQGPGSSPLDPAALTHNQPTCPQPEPAPPPDAVAGGADPAVPAAQDSCWGDQTDRTQPQQAALAPHSTAGTPAQPSVGPGPESPPVPPEPAGQVAQPPSPASAPDLDAPQTRAECAPAALDASLGDGPLPVAALQGFAARHPPEAPKPSSAEAPKPSDGLLVKAFQGMSFKLQAAVGRAKATSPAPARRHAAAAEVQGLPLPSQGAVCFSAGAGAPNSTHGDLQSDGDAATQQQGSEPAPLDTVKDASLQPPAASLPRPTSPQGRGMDGSAKPAYTGYGLGPPLAVAPRKLVVNLAAAKMVTPRALGHPLPGNGLGQGQGQ
ncbi:hypothetical protein V8C86DRAFT_2934078, partial [Haematococcus lacustris]